MKSISKFSIQWVSLFGLFLMLHSNSTAEQLFIDHCKHGCPIANEGDGELVARHLFASYVGESDLALWVSYRVFSETVGVASLLPRFWQEDRLIESELGDMADDSPRFIQPDLSNSQDRDYRVNEITLLSEDRGRLAPMTSFANTPYWEELNLLSNMSPMPSDLRLGPWSRLDQSVNELSSDGGYYFVVSGPLYESVDQKINNPLEPLGFFKVIASDDRLAVFEFPKGVKIHAPFCNYVSTLTSVQAKSDIDIFPQRQELWNEGLLRDLNCSVN